MAAGPSMPDAPRGHCQDLPEALPGPRNSLAPPPSGVGSFPAPASDAAKGPPPGDDGPFAASGQPPTVGVLVVTSLVVASVPK
ncbi:hypothetical protein SAMN06295924_11227 [Rathayibacter rathayi NCPPB 2980 = VKM Ac-1601]|nr:hypothetical protein FB469_3048 [Rathayibacter rathayi]SOE05667.1 hypothetical protein SAMN06295924_11227 [Rathayibacter rathayi NCPPB 2980 = VKM Ac-1601]